jgi:hypothetical protein
MLISPTHFRLIHQLPLVLALLLLSIYRSHINLVWSSSKGCPINIGPDFMSQGNLHRGNARGDLDADYFAHVHENLTTDKENMITQQ